MRPFDEKISFRNDDEARAMLLVIQARLESAERALREHHRSAERDLAFLVLGSALMAAKDELGETWGVFSSRFSGICGEEHLKSLAYRRKQASDKIFKLIWDKLIKLSQEHSFVLPSKRELTTGEHH